LPKYIKIAVTLLSFLVIYSSFVEPYWIQVNEIQIDEEPFASFFKSHRTIFISDIHATKLGIREKLLLDKINQLSPDLILIGGDIVAWGGDYEVAFEFLSRLNAREGVFGILGDSDFQDGRKSCNFCHAFDKPSMPFKARFLQNQAVRISAEEPAVFGLDMGSLDPESRTLTGVAAIKYPAILLSHKQSMLGEAPDVPLLILSGDTHGGQFWMMDWLWKRLFGDSKGPVRRGVVRQGGKTLVVSTGVGTSTLPLRLFTLPEIVLLKGG
jgi:hypothetical protein